MPKRLRRYYGAGHLHFITCSCYQRRPLLGSVRARNLFVQILGEVRDRFRFALLGYVVMPDHIHLLMSEPQRDTPSTVMQVLEQRVSRQMRVRRRRKSASGELRLWGQAVSGGHRAFWQRRFYDFNVWSRKKKAEKLQYMHFNPVKRGLVRQPKQWPWSSYRFYSGDASLLRIDAL